MKLQQVILAVVAFIVVLVVAIYPLHMLAVDLFPDSGTWVQDGLPELLGFVLAILAAAYCWKFAGRQAARQDLEQAGKKAGKKSGKKSGKGR